jgi:hypothetical protein
MTTLLSILILAAPFAALAAFVWLRERHQARRRDEIARQVALTDALHACLGAVVAPVVRRRRSGWQVAVAVPVGRPGVVATVLSTADEMFARAGHEIVLSRQSAPPDPPASRRTALQGESLSWT